MHSLCFIVAMCLLSSIVSAQPLSKEITILQSNERSIVFEYKPEYTSHDTIVSSGHEYLLFDFVSSQVVQSKETIGSPDLRFRGFPIGIPSESGTTVQVIAADYEDIPNTLLSPVPSLRMRDEMIEAKDYMMDPDKYSHIGFVPGVVAALSPPSRSRTMLLATVKVFPVQFNPATRTLRKYSRIVVEVVYAPTRERRVYNEDDRPFADVLLNFEQAKSWKFENTQPLVKPGNAPSVLATGEWYRLTIVDEGIYKLDAQFFASAGISLALVDPRTLKIFGNGGMEVPESIAQPRTTDLLENAIHVEGESDGQFNQGDYVLFYGKSTRGWKYDPVSRSLRHYINHYSEANVYWLTFGGAPGKRMQSQASSTETPTLVPDRFQDGTFVEEEKVNLLSSGKDWYGFPLSQGNPTTYTSMLSGLVLNDIIRYRYLLVARSELSPTFTVKQSGQVIGTHTLGTVSYDSPFAYATASPYSNSSRGIPFETESSSSLPNATSLLAFSFSSPSVSGTGWIDWIEILYPRRFDAASNALKFRSPDTTGIVEYQLGQFTVQPFIFNITRADDVKRMTGATGAYRIRAAEVAGAVSEYYAAADGTFKRPVGIERIQNQNLHEFGTGADFIIITSQKFRAAANRLAEFREDLAHGNLRTAVLEVDHIYNEFAGGLPDVTAIRDFLKYAYDTWNPRPRYLLMLGQASYDYKEILGYRSSYVPTWQSVESRDDVGSYATDDFFVQFGGDNALWLIPGRISSRTNAEANLVVEKIQRYETTSAKENWKMRMLYIGDDSWTPEREDGTIHSEAAEQLSRYSTPDEFDKKKIYIAEYPTVQTPQGRRKPGAYQAIIDEINQGVLAVNFTGHGNPTVWTHESIFNVQTSIPQLVNGNKLSHFFAATCNFSQFDDPKRYTGSEILLNKPDGGAVGVVSATRKVFAGSNNYLHRNIFLQLFRRNPAGRFADPRVATALYAFKAYGGNSVNDQKFFFMGDPTTEIQYPKGYAAIDSVNGEPVDSINGAPRVNPIRLKALSKVVVKGTIRGAYNQPDTTLSGRVALAVNDASRTTTIPNFAPGIDWSYIASGGTIYRGENSILGGRFRAEFVVPKDISYADSTSLGRLVAYFSAGDHDGAGYTSKVNISGTNTSAPEDGIGPSIALFLDSRSFRAGDLVSEHPTLYVDMTDASGINTSASGLGHRIEIWLNESPQSQDITEFYSSKLDDYTQGTAQYQLKGLAQGRNSIRVRAWDTYNNSSSSATFFEVTSADQLRISDVYNYPNPFSSTTTFTFRHNQLVPLMVKIKIYTIAGRLIQSLEEISAGEPFTQVQWDGRDRDGDMLANGVYLYKVILRAPDGRFSSEALGKLAIVK